jgi:L-alanine-DL-glutamate epimerase-like enolase superfamily enzyme
VFALETALLDLIAKARRLPAWAVLRGSSDAAPIPLSALAEGASAEDLSAAAERALERGIRVVKVKVGGPDGATRDPERLGAIRKRLGDAISLRLDANQSLPPAELASRLDGFAAFAPELLEEPARPGHLSELRTSPVPLALDESLMLDGWADRIAAAAALGTHAALVLKPMALGGFDRCLAMAEAAAAVGFGVIVTHVFDGPVGTAAAACLALAVRGRVLPCGLDAYGRLDRPVAAVDTSAVVPFDVEGLGVAFG